MIKATLKSTTKAHPSWIPLTRKAMFFGLRTLYRDVLKSNDFMAARDGEDILKKYSHRGDQHQGGSSGGDIAWS